MCYRNRFPGYNRVNACGSTRSVLVLKAEGTTTVVLSSQPSDCLVLKRDDVCCKRIETLHIEFDHEIIKSVNGDALIEPFAVLNSAISHLLDKFGPKKLCIQTGNLKSGIVEDGFDFGQTYCTHWNDKHDCLIIEWLGNTNDLLLGLIIDQPLIVQIHPKI